MHAALLALTEIVATLVAPARCAACDAAVRRATAFCPSCAETLVRASASDPAQLAAFEYGGAIAEAIRRFKFQDRPDLAPALAACLALAVRPLLGGAIDLVVPVPLHASRLVERGYNQAALLAAPMARLLGVPCAARALARSLVTGRQTDLTRVARLANVTHAFVARDPASLAGRRVLLVDDVETTGATLAACRVALLAAGCTAAPSAVVAKAQPRSPPTSSEGGRGVACGERNIPGGPAL